MKVLLDAEYITPVALEFMDREHLDEINLINRLYEILQHDLHISIVYPEAVECLQKLLEETRQHFANEESLMEDSHYPGMESHRLKHRAFLKTLQKAHEDFTSSRDRGKLISYLEDVLKSWFIEHLRTEDRRLAEYSRAQHSR